MLAAGLESLPHVVAVRGRGLMLACELDVDAPAVVREALLGQRLVLNATGPSTLRLLPALTISPRAGAGRPGPARGRAGERVSGGMRRRAGRTASSSTTIRRGSTSTPCTPTSPASPTGGSGAHASSPSAAIRGSRRVVGLYRGAEQVGFARAVSDGATLAYLADVYVLPAASGRGLGLELVREMVDGAEAAFGRPVRWMLNTADAAGPVHADRLQRGPLSPYPLMERARDYDSAP